jgi:hypothetical protein
MKRRRETLFVLLRRDPRSRLFGEWTICGRASDFCEAVDMRERHRGDDERSDDARWEYKIEATPTRTA